MSWIGMDDDKFLFPSTIHTYLERGPEYINEWEIKLQNNMYYKIVWSFVVCVCVSTHMFY